MLTREQVYNMLAWRKHANTLFFQLPEDVIKHISDFGQNPDSDIAIALHHAAFATQKDVDELLSMIKANPSLLLQAGNVITPGGDKVERITIYEFCLAAGDYDLEEKVRALFSGIENGEQQSIFQYERYRLHIEGMLHKKPYDITNLVNITKEAHLDDMTALLNKDLTRESKLRDAVIQFFKDWAPQIITKPRMLYNYASPQHGFKLLNDEWINLHNASRKNYDKIHLLFRLISFELRRLPGVDRRAVAQGIHNVIEKNEKFERTYKFKNFAGDFPVTFADDSFDGLGVNYGIDVAMAECVFGNDPMWSNSAALQCEALGKLMSRKNLKLAELMQQHPQAKPTGCITR
jgi:hypothetical protein